jgi:hypothetical protein
VSARSAAQRKPILPILVDEHGRRSAAAERAVDRLREKFGRAAVIRGIALEEDSASE